MYNTTYIKIPIEYIKNTGKYPKSKSCDIELQMSIASEMIDSIYFKLYYNVFHAAFHNS